MSVHWKCEKYDQSDNLNTIKTSIFQKLKDLGQPFASKCKEFNDKFESLNTGQRIVFSHSKCNTSSTRDFAGTHK